MKRAIPYVCSRWFEVSICAAMVLGPLSYPLASSAQAVPARFAIETSQIAAAMREGLLPVDGVQVQLAAPVTALVSAAHVKVQSVTPIGAHQMWLRLACIDRGECLPFLATATYPDAVDVSTLRLGRGPEPVADGRHGPKSPVAVSDAIRVGNATATKGAGLLRAGSTVTLQLEADRIHVRIDVISLQAGVPGSRVRVSSVDHKQIYTAEVITPTLLKGELLK